MSESPGFGFQSPEDVQEGYSFPEDVSELLEDLDLDPDRTDDLALAVLANQVQLQQLITQLQDGAGGGGGGDGVATLEPILQSILDAQEDTAEALADVESRLQSFAEQERGIEPGDREQIDRLNQLITVFGEQAPPLPPIDEMPVNSVGRVMEPISGGNEGEVEFFPGGGRISIDATPTGNVDPGDLVQVINREDMEVQQIGETSAGFNGIVVDTDTNDSLQLDAGESSTFQVKSVGATDVITLISDTQDGTPAQYEITYKAFVRDFDDYMRYDRRSDIQSRHPEAVAIPPKVRVTIKNTSGNDGRNYRVAVNAIRREG